MDPSGTTYVTPKYQIRSRQTGRHLASANTEEELRSSLDLWERITRMDYGRFSGHDLDVYEFCILKEDHHVV